MTNNQKLIYQSDDNYVPIPLNEQHLQTIIAEYFIDIPMDDVPSGDNIVEGLCFDRYGDLFVLNVNMSRIYKIDMKQKTISLFCQLSDGMIPAALKIHKDGRIFVTCISSNEAGGLVAVLSETGVLIDKIITHTGRMIDDMVFDQHGGFYFTDLSGTLKNPSSGVFYVEPDLKTIHTVVTGMVATNGIALDTQGKNLWVTEYGLGRLLYLKLKKDAYTIEDNATRVAYHFTGLEGPDSCCIDEDDNLYVAICGQARFMVFNKFGLPIGQILLPERKQGGMLKSTHIMLRPGTDEAYMCSADLQTGKSHIYKAHVFAKAYKSYQFQ